MTASTPLLIFQHECLVGHVEHSLTDMKDSAINGVGVMKEVKKGVSVVGYIYITDVHCVLDV